MRVFWRTVLICMGVLTLTFGGWNRVDALNITVPNVTPEMQTAQFWIGKLTAPDTSLMSAEEIEGFNLATLKTNPAVFDLTQYPATLDKEHLQKLIGSVEYPTDPTYIKGKKVSRWYYLRLQNELNFRGIKALNTVRYGFVVRRSALRLFPTQDRVFESPEDIEFDDYQASAVDPGEALLILHVSQNRKWAFVLSYNVRGWIPFSDIAIAPNRDIWLQYIHEPEFLIVTDSQLRLGVNPFDPDVSGLIFDMGAKLPIMREKVPTRVGNQSTDGNFMVELPTRNGKGELQFKAALVPMSSGVSLGYLPYTRAGLIRQAFKALGRRYGWGGMFESVDCSSFVLDVYRCFGFQFPRNTEEQKLIPGRTVDLQTSDLTESFKRLGTLAPGSLLHFNGHIMLYLGEEQGNPYIIHCLAAYYDHQHKDAAGQAERMNINQVVVSDLQLTRASGKAYWSCLDVGIDVQHP